MAQRPGSPGWRLFPQPTTGDGHTPTQKPKLSETNLGGGKAKGLRIPEFLKVGKHRKSSK